MDKDDLYNSGPLFPSDSGYDGDMDISDILRSILPQSPDTEDYDMDEADMEDYEDDGAPEDYEDDLDPEDYDSEYDEELDLTYADYDGYEDLGEYHSFDGSREYHSFDAELPDASPEEWYRYNEQDRELDEDDGDVPPEKHGKQRRHPVLSAVAHALLVFCTVFSLFYLIMVYSDNSLVSRLRTMYIQTAMSTINHKWMATAIIPSNIIDDVLRSRYETDDAMSGKASNWGNVAVQALPRFESETVESSETGETAPEEPEASLAEEDAQDLGRYESKEEQTFFELFWELDYDSVKEYMDEHPEALENGWSGVDINESALDSDGSCEGTSIKTIYGDEVLAVNAVDGITLIRIYPSNSRGVLAICKDTSRVSLCAASTWGVVGQTAGRICEDNGGILSMTGSAFIDPEGLGNGGEMSGLAVCDGTVLGTRLSELEPGAKRIELRNDNRMYIVDSSDAVDEDTRDACEFQPALIIDGEVFEQDWWNSPNPRTVLGQSERLETMMVVVEGRLSSSIGCGTQVIAELMAKYGCVQALNLDGGTSSIMYYKGEYITLCCNVNLPEGRTMPTAWVYK